MGPKAVHLLPAGTCECVTLHDKRNFADVNTVQILRGGDYPGLSGQEPSHMSPKIVQEGGGFPGGPVFKTPELPMQGAWVQSLVRELDRTCHHEAFTLLQRKIPCACCNEAGRLRMLQLGPRGGQRNK